MSPQNEGEVAGNRMHAGYGQVVGGSSLGGLDNGVADEPRARRQTYLLERLSAPCAGQAALCLENNLRRIRNDNSLWIIHGEVLWKDFLILSYEAIGCCPLFALAECGKNASYSKLIQVDKIAVSLLEF